MEEQFHPSAISAEVIDVMPHRGCANRGSGRETCDSEYLVLQGCGNPAIDEEMMRTSGCWLFLAASDADSAQFAGVVGATEVPQRVIIIKVIHGNDNNSTRIKALGGTNKWQIRNGLLREGAVMVSTPRSFDVRNITLTIYYR